jgi:glycosyltransferase involved in cell wall biosynthesis
MNNEQLISIVIPVFNESENIMAMIEAINKVDLHDPFEIIFVNDGSDDSATLSILKMVAAQYPHVHYISLVRNFGHQIALKAGIDLAKGDAIISMDGDLQHPPALLPEMIAQWKAGFDIVITKRIDYGDVSLFKKISSHLYYKIINALSSIPIQYGESDFRLLDKKVAAIFKKIDEPDLFLRGLTRWVGFEVTEIPFKAENRQFGSSKYSFKKMMRLGLNGIISFSSKPLYLSVYAGFASALFSIIVLLYTLTSMYFGHVVPGWASTLIIISFFSGMQLILMGIFGLYLSRVFMQTKNRPLYIIGENTYNTNEAA